MKTVLVVDDEINVRESLTLILEEKGYTVVIRNANKKTPVIVMSGDVVGEKFFKAAALLGAAVTLKKPFSAAALLEAIAGLIV